MKRTLVLTILIFTSLFRLQAMQSFDGPLLDDGDSFGVTIEPSFGYLIGQVREIVYLNGSSDEYVSELIWDLQDIFYIGITTSINIKNKFYINSGIWTSFYPGNGQMMDFDWLNLIGKSYDVHDGYGKSNWTNWSLSSVEIIKSIIFDFNLSYDFINYRSTSLAIVLGYKSLYWDWNDKVLDSIYPTIPAIWLGPEEGVNGIDYQLSLNIPYLGISGAYFPRKWFMQGRFYYSPFVIGRDHDHHILNETHYYDNVYFGQYLSATIKIGYQFNNVFSLSMLISGEYLFERRGTTVIYNDSGVKTGIYPGAAGIQYQSFSISLNTGFSF